MDQRNLFGEGRQLAEPAGKRERGTDRVWQNADAFWKDAALSVGKRVALGVDRLTSDDVREACDEAGVGSPHHVNAWGALMKRLAAAGAIAETESFRQSRRPDANCRVLRVWRSLLFRGTDAGGGCE